MEALGAAGGQLTQQSTPSGRGAGRRCLEQVHNLELSTQWNFGSVKEMSEDMGTETSREDRPPRDQAPLSEEDARGLVEQLRSAPAEQIIAEVLSTLLSTAQVKLGRRDARLFIDLCTLTWDYAGRYLSDELGRQVENALGQLRLGQVSAEKEIAKKGQSEPNDLSRIPTPPTAGGRAPASSGGQETPPSSRLWVPGR